MSDGHEPSDEGLEELLEFLREHRGFDFTSYKRPTLRRRVARRMSDVRVETYEAYLDHLQVHPEEFVALFNTILINVTEFFRDPDAWASLADVAIDPIVSSRTGSTQPIRVWTPACSSGQETYSVAILFAEAMGDDEFRSRVKIYGTDVDEEDLDRARRGVYHEQELENVSPDLRERYFEDVDDGFAFRKDLRRSVIFGRHDLLQDAPIGRLDLLTCRNTLMYFNTEAQKEILRRFHFALREGGYLFLGQSETLLTYSELYEPVDLRHRIFAPASDAPNGSGLPAVPRRSTNTGDHTDGPRGEVVVAAFAAAPNPQIVITDARVLLAANDAARKLFGIRPSDLGRPFHDLELSYRPVELRSVIDAALEDREPKGVTGVRWETAEQTRWLEVDVAPLNGPNGATVGVSVAFRDVSRRQRLEDELETRQNELETAYEELQSTNEELETTNEELQSTIEELETTNEELQSSNTELETMNEELRSANDELASMNEALHERTQELDESNAYLRSILSSLGSAAVVVDRELTVRLWNDRATELWGLRPDEVAGVHFMNLEIGLPVTELREPMLSALHDGDRSDDGDPLELEIQARDRVGRAVRCQVRCSPLVSDGEDVRGVILLMDAEAVDA
ncbi:MAG: CheR family methyltransferase [Nitriliruptorales bacterium]|nr:CheR family methyltransferase [Nitriliruptorales bacterium]